MVVQKLVSRADFSDQFRKIILFYKHIRFNIIVMQHSVCLMVNPIAVNDFAFLFI